MANANYSPIELEIRKLGLSEKEARTYLACLKLESASVQSIAKNSGFSRPTAYRILESLQKKGLVDAAKKRGSKLYVANSPDELLGLLRAEKRKVEEKEREFLRIISLLKSKVKILARRKK